MAATDTRPVAIALHSSGAGARQWEPYRPLIDPHWQWVAPDLLGYDNAMPWPPLGASTSLDAEARRVVALVAAFGSRPVHLIGHSYGGSVALQVALACPRRVASLTLYEPVRFALLRGHDDAAWDGIVRAGRRIGALALAGHLHESARVFVEYWSGEQAWQRLPAGRRDAIAQRMLKVQAEFEALFADPVQAADYAALALLPLRLVSGGASPLPAQRVADRLARLLPRAEFIRWADADHMAPLTQVERFARLLPCVGAGLQRAAA